MISPTTYALLSRIFIAARYNYFPYLSDLMRVSLIGVHTLPVLSG